MATPFFALAASSHSRFVSPRPPLAGGLYGAGAAPTSDGRMASALPDFDTVACLDRSCRISDHHHAAQRAHGACRRRASAGILAVRVLRFHALPSIERIGF